MEKRRACISGLCGLVTWCLFLQPAAFGFETLPGYESLETNPYGVEGDYVVGFLGYHVGNIDLAEHAFFYNITSNELTPLDHPAAIGSTRGDSIDGTRMVGFYSGPGGVYGFICDLNLADPTNSSWSTVNYGGGTQANGTHIYGIDGEYLVGRYIDPTGMEVGFLYDGHTWLTLIPPGATKVRAYGVDDSAGKVTGFYVNSTGAHGFLYTIGADPADPSAWTTFDAPSSVGTYAYGMDGNNIVGRFGDRISGKQLGFVYDWTTGAWSMLDYSNTRTFACGIDGNTVVGIYEDETGKVQGFWTSISATPTVTSFMINNGAASTTSRTVTLNNTATGSPTYYLASESSSFNGAIWEPYSPAPDFTLSAALGTKRVYFKVRSDSVTSAVVSDTISLVGPPEINVTQGGITVPDDTGIFDFGSVPTRTTKKVTFTIQNLGGSALNLTGTPFVTLSGPNAANFRVARQPTSPIAPSRSVTFVLSFRTAAAGVRTAQVSIANDDSDENPYNFTIVGTGI